MVLSLPVGAFECDLAIHRIRPPELVREDRDGVTYLAAEDYELAYETTLEFQNGARLPIKGKLFGEQNRQIVIRGSDGAPAQLRGWVRGSIQLFEAREQMIFRGTYFDVDLVIELTGDEDLIPAVISHDTFVHSRRVMEAILSGVAVKSAQASQQASTISS